MKSVEEFRLAFLKMDDGKVDGKKTLYGLIVITDT